MEWKRVIDAIAGLWRIDEPKPTVKVVLPHQAPLHELAAKHGGTVKPTGDGRWQLIMVRDHESELSPIIDDVTPMLREN